MNPMIAALQKSRQDAPPPTPAPDAAPGAPAAPDDAAGPGDVMVQKLQDLDAKLDQILELLGADQKEDAADENGATEAKPNDDGY